MIMEFEKKAYINFSTSEPKVERFAYLFLHINLRTVAQCSAPFYESIMDKMTNTNKFNQTQLIHDPRNFIQWSLSLIVENVISVTKIT